MITVIVNGANGRIGKVITEGLQANPKFNVIAQGTRASDLKVLITQNSPDIVLDFTNADSVYKNTRTIIEANVHPIIGSTGLLPAQIDELKSLAHEIKLGGIIAPNFSLGAILLSRFSAMAAKYFPQAEIIELHHDKKLDAPSGSAIKTADAINSVRNQSAISSKDIIEGARGANLAGTHIHSIRLKSLSAHQEVLFAGDGELLTLRHDCFNHEAYLHGVILACEKVFTLTELVYGLDTLL